jgi:hypothetical protein
LILLVAALALAVALLRGGRLRRLASVRLHRPWLVLAAAVSQLLGGVLADVPGAYAVGLGVSAALAAGFVLVNRRVAGITLLGVGLALNATVIAANGAMPVSVTAAARAGLDAAELNLQDDAQHEAVTPRTRLRPLADVVPVPVLREVVSVGDVVAALGIGWFLTAAVRPWGSPTTGREDPMAKKSRRRKARAKSKANHGKRPNS